MGTESTIFSILNIISALSGAIFAFLFLGNSGERQDNIIKFLVFYIFCIGIFISGYKFHVVEESSVLEAFSLGSFGMWVRLFSHYLATCAYGEVKKSDYEFIFSGFSLTSVVVTSIFGLPIFVFAGCQVSPVAEIFPSWLMHVACF